MSEWKIADILKTTGFIGRRNAGGKGLRGQTDALIYLRDRLLLNWGQLLALDGEHRAGCAWSEKPPPRMELSVGSLITKAVSS